MFCFLVLSALSHGHISLTWHPQLPEEGPLVAQIASSNLEAPETAENQGRDRFEGSMKGSGSTQSPPQLNLEIRMQAGKENSKKILFLWVSQN
jgi:hypothetical protein